MFLEQFETAMHVLPGDKAWKSMSRHSMNLFLSVFVRAFCFQILVVVDCLLATDGFGLVSVCR